MMDTRNKRSISTKGINEESLKSTKRHKIHYILIKPEETWRSIKEQCMEVKGHFPSGENLTSYVKDEGPMTDSFPGMHIEV